MVGYLKFVSDREPIIGDSRDLLHLGWVEVFSYSFGPSGNGLNLSNGTSKGGSNIRDLTVTKYLDHSSASLLKAYTSGQEFSTVVFDAGAGNSMQYTWSFEKAMIDHITPPSSSVGDDRLLESVTLKFAAMHVGPSVTGAIVSVGQAIAQIAQFARSRGNTR